MSLMNHEAGRDCLLELDDLLCGLGVPHFLLQGTALGAWRDKGFVPHERDIDIGVLQEHLQPKVPALLGRLQAQGFDVEVFQMPFTRPRTVVAFKQYPTGIAKADIVGLARWRDWRFTQTACRAYVEEPYAIVHRADLLEGCRETATLWGRRFLVPRDIEYYLMCEYGPRWREPRDDHVSRTRVYNFIEREGIPRDYLERWG